METTAEDTDLRFVVEFDNVYFRSDRGQEVFRDLNFKLEAGHSAIIFGAAGAGKTCLVELLIGKRFAEAGSVEVLGRQLLPRKYRAIREVRRKTGGIGGLFGLIPSYTVAQNIEFPMIIAGVRKKVRKERLLKMLTEFSLLKQAAEYPNRLTRVEHTLVQFARASVGNQPLIIIDEPLAGLDPKTYQRILSYLVNLSVSGRSMIILSSQDLSREIPNIHQYTITNGALV